MNGIEHYKQAEEHLALADTFEYGSDEERYNLAVAQVHATLAAANALPIVTVDSDATVYCGHKVDDRDCVLADGHLSDHLPDHDAPRLWRNDIGCSLMVLGSGPEVVMQVAAVSDGPVSEDQCWPTLELTSEAALEIAAELTARADPAGA